MKVRYSYLRQQFSNCPELWIKLKKFVLTGDFTLGKELEILKKTFKINWNKICCRCEFWDGCD